jgi:hypothetical protein
MIPSPPSGTLRGASFVRLRPCRVRARKNRCADVVFTVRGLMPSGASISLLRGNELARRAGSAH